MIAGENLKNPQKLYKLPENGARRRPCEHLTWDTRQVSPARKFVFTPRQIQIKTPYCGERERTQNWRVLVVYDPDGGISVLCVADGGVWGGNPPRQGNLSP